MGATVAAINRAGDVAGVVVSDRGVRHPALWRRGALVDLGVPPGYMDGAAVAVNDSGVVLARVWAPPPRRWALAPTAVVLWRGGRFCQPTNLPPRLYPAASLDATALNDAGQFSGTYEDSAGQRPYVWASARWRGFGGRVILQAYQTETVTALNDSGVFVGQIREVDEEGEDRRHGIVRRGDSLALVAYAPGRTTEPVAINNRGDILGSYREWGGGPQTAFVARAGRPLATFPPRVPLGAAGPRARRRVLVPVAMNNASAWVGVFEGGPPVVVSADGAIRPLPVPAEFAGRPVAPAAINDSGVVAGWVDLTDRADRARGALRGVGLVWRDGVPSVLPLAPVPSSVPSPVRGETSRTRAP